MTSPENSSAGQSSGDTGNNHRVILRLHSFKAGIHLGDRAGRLQRAVRAGQTKLVGNIAIASDTEHIYIDTVRAVKTEPIDVLAQLIEEADDAVVACGIPAEIDAAFMSDKTYPDLVTQFAWLEMGRDETADVTQTTIELAATHRERDLDTALAELLPHVS
jgi:hypothetical protein